MDRFVKWFDRKLIEDKYIPIKVTFWAWILILIIFGVVLLLTGQAEPFVGALIGGGMATSLLYLINRYFLPS